MALKVQIDLYYLHRLIDIGLEKRIQSSVHSVMVFYVFLLSKQVQLIYLNIPFGRLKSKREYCHNLEIISWRA